MEEYRAPSYEEVLRACQKRWWWLTSIEQAPSLSVQEHNGETPIAPTNEP